ncbi:MAG: O-antigen ligase family protein [Armatimonadota bacterium]
MPAPVVMGVVAAAGVMAWALLRMSAAGSTAKALALALLIPASAAALLSVYAGLLILVVVASTDAFLKAWLGQTWPSLLMKDYFLFLCLVGWLSGRPWQQRGSSIDHSLVAPVAAFAVWVLLEIFNWHGKSLPGSLAGARAWLIWIPLFFIAHDSVRTQRALAWLVAWVAGVGALAGSYGVAQLTYGAQGLLKISPGFGYALGKYKFWTGPGKPVSRAFSTLSHPNELGIFMAVTTLLAIAGLLFSRRPIAKLAYVVVGVVAVAGMIASGTRSAFIMTAFGCLVMLAAARRVRLAIAILVLISLAGAVTTAITGPVMLSRVTAIWEDVDYTLHRPYSPWRAAVRSAPKFPLGRGLDSGQGVAYALFKGQRLSMQGHVYENQYAQALADLGIVGLGLYVWMLYAVLRTTYRSVRALEGQDSFYLALGVFAITAGLCLSLLVKANLYTAPNGLLFWILSGASAAQVGAAGAGQREQLWASGDAVRAHGQC